MLHFQNYKPDRYKTYPHGFIGLKAIHVVGSPKTPGRKKLEQVNFDWCLHKNNIVWSQTKTVQRHKWTCEWEGLILYQSKEI